MIRIVCFDIGGVLVQHRRTWREGCEAAGLPIRGSAESESVARLRKDLARQFTIGAIDEAAFCLRMSEAGNHLYSPAEIRLIHHAWLGPEYPGVGDVVRRLVDSGRVATGILSNTNAAHWARLEPSAAGPAEFPTPSLLSNRHASHLLGAMKPDAEAFAAFERHTGFAGPEILFLEDLPDNLAAAAARGWTCHAIDFTRPTADQIESALAAHGIL